MTVYVVYRIDKVITGYGYYMPLDLHVFTDKQKAHMYVRKHGYAHSGKYKFPKCYGVEYYVSTNPNVQSTYLIEAIEQDKAEC